MPMNAASRRVIESPKYQGQDEIKSYSVTTTPWSASPTSPTCTLFDITDGAYTEVTSASLSGLASVAGNVITSPLVGAPTSLTNDKVYRLEFRWTVGSEREETWVEIRCQR